MIRTIIILLLGALAVVPSMAQQLTEIGTWEVFPVFAPPAQKVIDTGGKVYYQSGGNLFEYDPKTDESFSYTRLNKLSDFEVTNIFYNYEEKYLLVVYESGNMDVVYPSGKVVNISDMSDSELTRPLKVNDVAFAPGKMYLATSFGVVEYNMSRNEVVQSGVWNTNVGGIEIMNGHLVMVVDGMGLMSVPQGNNFAILSSLKHLGDVQPVDEIKSIDNTHLLLRSKNTTSHGVILAQLDLENDECTETRRLLTTAKCQPFVKANGNIYIAANNRLWTLNSDYNIKEVCLLPEMVQNECISTVSGKNKI